MVSNELLILCMAAFTAGFVDSIVGGGGLIQLPAFMLVLPTHQVVNLLATNKLVSMSGTALSAWRFSKQIPFDRRLLFPSVIAAFTLSLLGAWTVTQVSNETLKPFFLILLLAVFVLTIRQKSFGMRDHDPHVRIPIWKPILLGGGIGFYDGFFGPGTGSLLIISFVGVLGMTFVQGSAHAKIINLGTNLAAILLFTWKAEFLLAYAIPMILFNMGGALLGVKLALLKGNTFVRNLLRAIVFLTILRLSWDLAVTKF